MKESPYIYEPLRYWNEIPVFSESNIYIENYEKVANDHVSHYNKTGQNPFMDETHWKTIEQSTRILLDKYVKKGDKILDVGVGMGRLLENYSDTERYGMDISTSYLLFAKKSNINCCISLVEDMPYQDNFFDIITCTDVLEHVLDLNLCIKNILRVLKPGGKLIVRVPNQEDISWYLSESCPYEFVHLRSFDESNLKALFTKIFKTKFIESSTAGELLTETRLKYPPPPYNKYLRKAVNLYYNWKLKKDPETYKSYFNKLEINVVVEKI